MSQSISPEDRLTDTPARDFGLRGHQPAAKNSSSIENVLGRSVDLVEHPRNLAPEKVLKFWVAEWAKEGREVDWQKLMPSRPVTAERWHTNTRHTGERELP